MASGRVPTFVEGLDTALGGGIPAGHVVLVEGSAGTMKSTLAYHLLLRNAVESDRSGLYITLEQSRQDLEEQMVGLGMDKGASPRVGQRLVVIDLGELRAFLSEAQEDERDVDWFRSVLNQVRNYRGHAALDLLVLDSMNGLLAIQDQGSARLQLFHFIKELKQYPMTTFLISERAPGEGDPSEATQRFLADGILHLEVQRTGDLLRLQLGIVKMRKTLHEHRYYPFMYSGGRFRIVAK